MYFGNLSFETFKCKNFALSEYQWKTGISVDQMNCTKKQHSLICETENLFDLIYYNFGLVYFAK